MDRRQASRHSEDSTIAYTVYEAMETVKRRTSPMKTTLNEMAVAIAITNRG